MPIVSFDPGDIAFVTFHWRPVGSRTNATKPSAAASGSTVIIFDASLPGATASVSDPIRSPPRVAAASASSAK
jgi:hypothetical protein